MLDVLKWLVYGAVLVVLLPYTVIALAGMVMGVARQLRPKPPVDGNEAP